MTLMRTLARADAWDDLVSDLPPNYRLLVQGPNSDGKWSVGVIRKTRPVGQVASGYGELYEALKHARTALTDYLEAK